MCSARTAAIARAQQRALEQCAADPVTLPGLFDGEGGFRRARKHRADVAQLGGAAQRAVDEKAMHHRVDALGGGGVGRDRLVRHRAGEAGVPAVLVEAQEVVAVGVGLADPQFADEAAVGQKLVHCRGLQFFFFEFFDPAECVFPSLRRGRIGPWRRSYLYDALQ